MTLLLAGLLGSHILAGSSLAAADASEAEKPAQAAAFRARALADMQAALGARIRVRQDAINAAYFRVGWNWGQETTLALDNAAHNQARKWGFTIRDFTRAGRHERFSLDQLADHALEGDEDIATMRLTSTVLPRPHTPEQAPRAQRTDGQVDELEQRVKLVGAELDAVIGDIGQLEHDVRTHPATSKERSSEIRVAIATLERLLGASEHELGECAQDLVSLADAANK